MKVAVIGGGAAGMMAALSAAESGAEVILLEKNEKLGKKLFITGKGRCNLTNDAEKEAFFAHILRNPRFLYSSYGRFDNRAMMDLMEAAGLRLKVERGGRVFPASDKSSDVIRTLEKLRAEGVQILLISASADVYMNRMPRFLPVDEVLATPRLTGPARLMIILFMYFGRVGVLTISFGFLKNKPAGQKFKYAETDLLIG